MNLVYKTQGELTVHYKTALELFASSCRTIILDVLDNKTVPKNQKYDLSITHDDKSIQLVFLFECDPVLRRSIRQMHKIVLSKQHIHKAESRLRSAIRLGAVRVFENVELKVMEEFESQEHDKERALYKRYTKNVRGAPYQIGERVTAMGCAGTVVALDYNGCGQTYPEDPLVIVRHDSPNEEGEMQDGYWSEEII